MPSVLTFISEDVLPYEKVLERLSNLLNHEIKNPSSRSNSETKLLREIQTNISKGNIANSVTSDIFNFKISPQELNWLDKHDEARWIDYLLHRVNFRLAESSTTDVPAFPPHLLIEPTSICNLRCIMCFQVDETFNRDKKFMGLMPWELFTSIVDQAVDNNCNAITMASRGEPTLHKKFGDMLRYVHAKGILDTKINTNATRLNEDIIHAILESEIGNVTFSVDAITPESYEKIRVRGKFNSVLSNVKQFNEIREKHYPKSPTTTRISGVAVNPDQNPHEMQAFWSKYVDEVTIVPNQQRWDSYNNPKFSRTELCRLLYSRMYVWWDGTCNPCDFDYKSLLQVGNANEQSLKDIWHGERYSAIREHHENSRRSKLNPCDRCPL